MHAGVGIWGEVESGRSANSLDRHLGRTRCSCCILFGNGSASSAAAEASLIQRTL